MKAEYIELAKELICISKRCYERGYVASTNGNNSVRTPDNAGLLIKRTGVCFTDMELEDVVFVDWDGNYDPALGKPSKEYNFHLGIYKVRPEVNAVIHLHSPHATALSIARGEVDLVVIEAQKVLKKVPTVPLNTPGSMELANSIVDEFRGTEIIAVTMAEHGIVTVGSSLREGYYRADMLEHNATVSVLAKSIQK